MADNKKYYYLKVKDNFYDSEEMIILQNMPDGYLYSDILMKLYLRSLKSEGKLMFKDRIPYNSTILAQVVRHSVGVVEKALQLFKELGLIEILDNGSIYLLDIQNYIGHSSSEADRQREYYNKIKSEKNNLLLPCKKSNKKPCKKSYMNSTPEIELEIKKEKEIEKNKSIVEVDDFFESIWSLYPKKEGKGSISKSQKLKLFKIGIEEITRAINRYKQKIQKEGIEKKYIKQGSTFFNSGYIDYLDSNSNVSEVKTEKQPLKMVMRDYI